MLIIKNIDSIKTGAFTREPIAGQGICYVYRNTRGKFHLVESGKRISQIELKADRYTIRYTVDQTKNLYKHSAEYQSKDPGRSFQVSIQMNITVDDPIAVVQHDIKDIKQYMDANVKHWIGTIVGASKIEEFQELKYKVHNITEHIGLVNELWKKGLAVSELQVNLSLGKNEWEFYQKQQEIRREAELERVRLQELERVEELKRQSRLKDEEEQRERERAEREERLKEEERIARLKVEEGIDRLILARSSENKDNVDIIVKKEQEKEEHERKTEQDRIEHERAMDIKRMEQENKILERKMDMMQKMIELQMKNEFNEPETLFKMMRMLNEDSSSSQTQLESQSTEKKIDWGGNTQVKSEDEKENTKDEDWS